uniref:Transmembrane protein n=1 Tax=Cannabis sativa TaxID=3483 RepID=A0A803QUB0_CANSA
MVKRDQIGAVVIVVLTLIILIGQVNCGRQSSEFFKGMIPKSSSSSTAHDHHHHHHHHHEDYFLVSKPKGVSIPPSSPSKQHYDIGLQSSTNSP